MKPNNQKKYFVEKCLLAFAFFFLCVNHSLLYANTNQTIEQLTQEVASKSNKVIRKQLPEEAKIALCLFMGSNLKNEPIKTTLGIKITEAFYHQLILKTKKEYTVIFPDGLSNKVLSDASGKYFEPPKNAEDEAKFWQSYLDGQKPEYYITGQYLLEKNRVTLKNIFISSDIYSNAPIKFTIENVDFEIDQSTYNELDLIDREIKPFSDPIMELLNLKKSLSLLCLSRPSSFPYNCCCLLKDIFPLFLSQNSLYLLFPSSLPYLLTKLSNVSFFLKMWFLYLFNPSVSPYLLTKFSRVCLQALFFS
jgi:hypothetical protein